MHSDNCFLLLGKTGVGKSTLTKILSEDESVKIGDSLKSETKDTCSYKCQIDNFNYLLIDTPGYDDSDGNDSKNFLNIKQSLTSNNYNIKGIVLMFSFQDPRFGESHRKGLERIVSLIPLDNFWDYITIIFTRTFSDDEDELEEEKNKKLKYFQQIFDTLISAFYKTKNIKKVSFSKINKVFVNLKVKKTKKEKLSNITSIFKTNSKLEPLFHKLKIEEKLDRGLVLHKDNENIGDLFEVKFKIYNYLNQNEQIIKTISKPVEKKFIKQIEKKEFDGQFQANCTKTQLITCGLMMASIVGFFASATIPPLCLGFFFSTGVFNGISLSSFAARKIKDASEYYSNKEFNELKVIEELENIEKDF